MTKKQKVEERASRILGLCASFHFRKKPKGVINTFLDPKNYDISFDGRVDNVKIQRQKKRGSTRVIFNSFCLEGKKDEVFNPSDLIDALISSIESADSA